MQRELPVFRVRLPVPQKFGSAPPSRRSPSFAAHHASERLRRDENRGVHSSDRGHAAHVRHRGIPGPGVSRPGPREPASRARAFGAHSPPLDLRRAGGVPGGAPRPPLHVGRSTGIAAAIPSIETVAYVAVCGGGPRHHDVGEHLGDGSVGRVDVEAQAKVRRVGASAASPGSPGRAAPRARARRCDPASGACTVPETCSVGPPPGARSIHALKPPVSAGAVIVSSAARRASPDPCRPRRTSTRSRSGRRPRRGR